MAAAAPPYLIWLTSIFSILSLHIQSSFFTGAPYILMTGTLPVLVMLSLFPSVSFFQLWLSTVLVLSFASLDPWLPWWGAQPHEGKPSTTWYSEGNPSLPRWAYSAHSCKITSSAAALKVSEAHPMAYWDASASFSSSRTGFFSCTCFHSVITWSHLPLLPRLQGASPGSRPVVFFFFFFFLILFFSPLKRSSRAYIISLLSSLPKAITSACYFIFFMQMHALYTFISVCALHIYSVTI